MGMFLVIMICSALLKHYLYVSDREPDDKVKQHGIPQTNSVPPGNRKSILHAIMDGADDDVSLSTDDCGEYDVASVQGS